MYALNATRMVHPNGTRRQQLARDRGSANKASFKELERENKELPKIKEILKTALAIMPKRSLISRSVDNRIH